MADIQDRIKEIRTLNSLTQERFAELVGTTRNNYAQIETKKSLPSIEILQSIVKNFNTTFEYLINGVENEVGAEKPKVQKKLYNESITKSITKSITNEKCKKSYTLPESTSNPPDNTSNEIIQLLKENKKLVEEKNSMLEKEVSRLSERNLFLESENKRLSSQNTHLQAQNNELSNQLQSCKKEALAFKKGLQSRSIG